MSSSDTARGARSRVNVITPTYNRARFLPETIDSILQQDYPDVELIVVDDGSTDETQEIMASYGDRIVSLRHNNMGQAASINRAAQVSEGEFIMVVNSDDPLLPGAIRALVEAMETFPHVGLAYPDFEEIGDDGNVVLRLKSLPYSYVDMIRLHYCFPGPGAMMRRSAWEDVGGWDPTFRFVPDYDFYLRLGLDWPFLHVPACLARWRVHDDALTTGQRGWTMAEEHVKVIHKLFARDNLPLEVEQVRAEALRTAYYVAGLVVDDFPNLPGDRFSLVDQLATIVEHVNLDLPVSHAPRDVVNWLHHVIAMRDAKVALQQGEVDSLSASIEQLRAEIADQEVLLSSMYEEARQREQRLEVLGREAIDYLQTVQSLHDEVATRDQTIEWLHSEVAQRDEVIGLLQQARAADGTPAGQTDNTYAECATRKMT